MSVPVSKRNESRFEAEHHFYRLRSDVTELIFTNFGYSAEKYKKTIAKYREMHRNNTNCDDIVQKMEARMQSFEEWFITQERDTVLTYLRLIETEFTVGNSIYPGDGITMLLDFFMRRYHLNKAISYCYALKQEINYVIRTLPVDVNKYKRFSDSIDEQIKLYKGVRRASNRLLSGYKKNDEEGKSVWGAILSVADGFALIVHRFFDSQEAQEG